jgi:hypothetical protein
MNKNKATISADIVSSTALNVNERLILDKKLLELLKILEENFGSKNFYGRLIKGDYIECVLEKPKHALRCALLIKSFVKSLHIEQKNNSKRISDFKEYGVRIAVGIGELKIFDRERGIIDGEAIYLSGRAINEMTAHNKKINNTLIFRTLNKKQNDYFEPIFELLDVMFARFKQAQSEIVFYKLLEKSEKEIVSIINKNQSTINQHSTATGWHAIDSAVKYFEKTIK